MQTRNYLQNKKNTLISATRISNYIKNDMIIDYLDLLNEKKMILNENLKVTRKRTQNDILDNNDFNQEYKRKKSKSSFDYIVEAGYLFENDILKQIESMMIKKNEYKKIIKLSESNINLNCNQTIKTIIEDKHTVILNAVLINEINNTWGKPDLLVKGEWIKKYIHDNIPYLDSKKWYVIDIKSSTINLINKGEEVSSMLLYNVYKSQIYIYTDALNVLLKKYNINNNVNYGFILGKKYKYTINKNIINKKPFEYLGIIDFKKGFNNGNNGNNWNNLISDAINWNNDLRLNWKDYNVNPINKDELYPNMKNTYDKNWHKIKKEIAIKNKELTLLWNCGITNRKLAWENNIKHYDDPQLNSSILGFKNTSKETIVNSMLKILHSEKNYHLNKLNDCMEWQTKSKWEFFIDFETYNKDAIYDENYDWDNSFNNNKIYMIGLSYFTENNILIHKSFILEYEQYNELKNEFKNNIQFDDVKYEDCIFCKDEMDLIKKFSDFIKSFKPLLMDMEFFKKNIRLCHWSGAEPILFNKKIEEYKLNNKDYWFNWYDLLKIFKHDRYPIIIKECFGFGLKEIIKKLNQYGLIKLSWSDLDDGLLSSFIARDIYIKNNGNNINNDMYYIIEYNYIDCKALHYILEWMRKEVK